MPAPPGHEAPAAQVAGVLWAGVRDPRRSRGGERLRDEARGGARPVLVPSVAGGALRCSRQGWVAAVGDFTGLCSARSHSRAGRCRAQCLWCPNGRPALFQLSAGCGAGPGRSVPGDVPVSPRPAETYSLLALPAAGRDIFPFFFWFWLLKAKQFVCLLAIKRVPPPIPAGRSGSQWPPGPHHSPASRADVCGEPAAGLRLPGQMACAPRAPFLLGLGTPLCQVHGAHCARAQPGWASSPGPPF